MRMPLRNSVALGLTLLGAAVSARDVPGNIQHFLVNIRAQKQCQHVLAGGFHSSGGDSGDFEYCGDHVNDFNVVYLQGRNGQLVNLDVDCDGAQGGGGGDGRCASSRDTQAQTSFRNTLRGYGAGLDDLDASVHPYVVFGNSGSKPGWRTFDPVEHGIEPLSVMAVVCDGKLIYGVWGDTNGDDGEGPMVGEASLSLASACFGNKVDGNAGHDQNDVLYIAFPGKDAVPGPRGAKWDARSYAEFEESISGLGDRLIQRIGGPGRGGGNKGRGGGNNGRQRPRGRQGVERGGGRRARRVRGPQPTRPLPPTGHDRPSAPPPAATTPPAPPADGPFFPSSPTGNDNASVPLDGDDDFAFPPRGGGTPLRPADGQDARPGAVDCSWGGRCRDASCMWDPACAL